MNFLIFTSGLNALACTALAWVVYRRASQPSLGRAGAIFNLSVAFYSLWYCFWQGADTPTQALFFHRWVITGVIWVQQAYLYFIFMNLRVVEEKRPILIGVALLNVVFTVLNWNGGLYATLEPRMGVGLWPVPTVWAGVYIAFWHMTCFYGFGLLILEAIRNRGARRQQMIYLAAAYQIGYFGAATNWLVWYSVPLRPYLNSLIVVYVAIIAYAIVRHRLLDVDLILKKTLVYSAVTGALTVVYISSVVALAFTMEKLGRGLGTWAWAGAVLLVAGLFHPLRERIQAMVDRRFFRITVDPQAALDRLSSQIVTATAVEEVALAFFSVLSDTVHPKRMALYVFWPADSTFHRVMAQSDLGARSDLWPATMLQGNLWTQYFASESAPAEPLAEEMKRLGVASAFPLMEQSLLVGYLLLGEKRSETMLSPEDLRWIQAATAQATLAILRLVYFHKLESAPTAGLLQDVASGFVHEIKTPLANIHLPAQAIFAELTAIEQGRRQAGEQAISKLKQRMKFIMAQTVKASDRIEAIRDFAAVEDPRQSAVEVSVVFQDCLATLDQILQQNEVEVETDFPNRRVFILGHPKQLEIVLANLIKNAAEAMGSNPNADQPRHLKLTVSEAQSQVTMTVQDSGPGFPEEVRSRLFEKYFTTKGAAGTGVGLHLCRKIVEAMNGTIEASSRPNQGAVMTLRFPAHQPRRSSAERSGPAPLVSL